MDCALPEERLKRGLGVSAAGAASADPDGTDPVDEDMEPDVDVDPDCDWACSCCQLKNLGQSLLQHRSKGKGRTNTNVPLHVFQWRPSVRDGILAERQTAQLEVIQDAVYCEPIVLVILHSTSQVVVLVCAEWSLRIGQLSAAYLHS